MDLKAGNTLKQQDLQTYDEATLLSFGARAGLRTTPLDVMENLRTGHKQLGNYCTALFIIVAMVLL